VDAAVEAAREAYPAWRLVPLPSAPNTIPRRETILKRKEDLAREMTREMARSSPKRAATCRKPST